MNFVWEFWRYFWHRAHTADKGRLVGILGAVPWLEEGGSWQCWGFPGLAQQMVLWSSHLGFYKPKVKFFMLRILLLYKLWLQGDKYCLRGWKCVCVCVCVCVCFVYREMRLYLYNTGQAIPVVIQIDYTKECTIWTMPVHTMSFPKFLVAACCQAQGLSKMLDRKFCGKKQSEWMRSSALISVQRAGAAWMSVWGKISTLPGLPGLPGL